MLSKKFSESTKKTPTITSKDHFENVMPKWTQSDPEGPPKVTQNPSTLGRTSVRTRQGDRVYPIPLPPSPAGPPPGQMAKNL